MVKKSKLWVAALVLVVAGVAAVFTRGGDTSGAGGSASGAAGSSPSSSLASRGAARGGAASASEAPPPRPLREDPEIQKLLAHIQTRYGGERLKNQYVQIKLIEDLVRYFRQNHPERWEAALLEFLREAFPERYEELAAKLRAWVGYEQFMRENEGYLQQLGDEERRKNVWAERERLFGAEAAREIWASELKAQAVTEALAAIDARTDVKLGEKVKLYRDSLQETYGEKTEAFLERHRQEAMNRFLDLNSVQKELSAMKPEERSRSLREIRTCMGLDAEALQRWDVLDRERDGRWDVGAKYMQEREALAKQYSGEALEERLRPVRERHFGAEAETIAGEEQSGFFRFERPRVWGRN
jgi:hypothetical protein